MLITIIYIKRKHCRCVIYSNNMESFLSCNNVSFSYANNGNILKDINFSMQKGETLAIVGASGSGK